MTQSRSKPCHLLPKVFNGAHSRANHEKARGKTLQEVWGGFVRAPFPTPPPPRVGALLSGHSQAPRSRGTGQGPQNNKKHENGIFGIGTSWGVRAIIICPLLMKIPFQFFFARKWPKSRSLAEGPPFQYCTFCPFLAKMYRLGCLNAQPVHFAHFWLKCTGWGVGCTKHHAPNNGCSQGTCASFSGTKHWAAKAPWAAG